MRHHLWVTATLLYCAPALAQTCPGVDVLGTSNYTLFAEASDGTPQHDTKTGTFAGAVDVTATRTVSSIHASSRLIVAKDTSNVRVALTSGSSVPGGSGSSARGTAEATLRLKLVGGAASNTVVVRLYRKITPSGRVGLG